MGLEQRPFYHRQAPGMHNLHAMCHRGGTVTSLFGRCEKSTQGGIFPYLFHDHDGSDDSYGVPFKISVGEHQNGGCR